MKNKALKEQTKEMQKSADIIYEAYIVGLQLERIGEMFTDISKHMADLQKKIDSQAEELRKYQKGGAV